MGYGPPRGACGSCDSKATPLNKLLPRIDKPITHYKMYILLSSSFNSPFISRGGRNRIGRREKWPKKIWEEGEIGGKSR